MINVGAFRNVPKYSRNPSVICCPQAEPKIPSSAHTLNSPGREKMYSKIFHSCIQTACFMAASCSVVLYD